MYVGVDLILRDGEACLISPDLQVSIGRVGGDGNTRTSAVRFRSLRLITRGLGTAAQPAEQIDLPARHGSDGVFLIGRIAGKLARHPPARALETLALPS